jgi:hydroxymethylpyrimidine/phosphomethylpyrimidine kinase
VLAAVTAQNTTGVSGIHVIPPEFILAQIDAVYSDLSVGAVKVGMVGNEAAIMAVAEGLRRWPHAPVVLDPVMIAESGGVLLEEGAEAALRSYLLPLAHLITPNLPEAARLLGASEAVDETMMVRQGELLLALGPKAVLIKGGHAQGPEAVDMFLDGTSVLRLAADRVPTRNTHGTGCTLSAAVAAGLASGLSLLDSVRRAKAYLTNALIHADELQIGRGSGPVHHFFDSWKRLE